MPATPRPRILSGVQPSGKLHLGNYFGAIKQHIELQDQGECYFFIADFHSLTTVKNREVLSANIRDVAITYLALGLDPEKTVFYRQSDVPEVTEIAWLLATVTGMGLLERAHSYKDKIAKGLDASVGLFYYPVLMAADILAPRSNLVPVGQDQQQHVEMTRDMASYFNNTFPTNEPVFVIPEARFNETPKVPGTTFEKGKVVVITAEIKLKGDHASVDVPAMVAALRGHVQQIVTADESVQTTEAIEKILAATPGIFDRLPEFESRHYRVASAMPAGDHRTETKGDDVLVVEFGIGVPREIFLTNHGHKVAAKMSKSYGNTIEIFAEGKPLKKAVMAVETEPLPIEAAFDADTCLVFALYKLFANADEQAAMREKYTRSDYGYGHAKKELLEKIDTYFAPFREKRKELEANPDFVEEVLREGAKKARAVARETLSRAREACGLPPILP